MMLRHLHLKDAADRLERALEHVYLKLGSNTRSGRRSLPRDSLKL